MNHLTEMFKGMLEGCILEIISKNNTYGYEITEKLRESGFTVIANGTVYCALKRMKEEG